MERSRTVGLFGSVLLAHLVLVLHGIVLLLLAFLVLFFRGVIAYLPWIVLGGGVVLLVSGWYCWRSLKRRGRGLGDVLSHPLIQERGLEVRLLGGVASLRLGPPGGSNQSLARVPLQIEAERVPALPDDSSEAERMRALARLVKLREAGELDEEAFQLLRRELVGVPSEGEASSRRA
ncbi:MAG: hypothetical protein D6751_05305 [Deltaproteobacteria bacterium]|nr:MAG: hypothetical protein D6751_05305 [Deltaproteobacteria bacterium]